MSYTSKNKIIHFSYCWLTNIAVPCEKTEMQLKLFSSFACMITICSYVQLASGYKITMSR